MHKQWGLRALDFHDTCNKRERNCLWYGHSETWYVGTILHWSCKFHQDTIIGKKRSAAAYNPYSLCSQRHICVAYDKFTSLSRFISDAPFLFVCYRPANDVFKHLSDAFSAVPLMLRTFAATMNCRQLVNIFNCQNFPAEIVMAAFIYQLCTLPNIDTTLDSVM